MPRTFVWHPGKGPSTVSPNAFKDGEMVRIKQVRSGIGHEARMRRTLAAMGLQHHQAVIERPMSAGLRGQIKQVRSGIGHSWRMRRTLEALGLKHHQDVVVKAVSPALRGQLKQVRHLIEVTPVEEI